MKWNKKKMKKKKMKSISLFLNPKKTKIMMLIKVIGSPKIMTKTKTHLQLKSPKVRRMSKLNKKTPLRIMHSSLPKDKKKKRISRRWMMILTRLNRTIIRRLSSKKKWSKKKALRNRIQQILPLKKMTPNQLRSLKITKIKRNNQTSNNNLQRMSWANNIWALKTRQK